MTIDINRPFARRNTAHALQAALFARGVETTHLDGLAMTLLLACRDQSSPDHPESNWWMIWIDPWSTSWMSDARPDDDSGVVPHDGDIETLADQILDAMFPLPDEERRASPAKQWRSWVREQLDS